VLVAPQNEDDCHKQRLFTNVMARLSYIQLWVYTLSTLMPAEERRVIKCAFRALRLLDIKRNYINSERNDHFLLIFLM